MRRNGALKVLIAGCLVVFSRSALSVEYTYTGSLCGVQVSYGPASAASVCSSIDGAVSACYAANGWGSPPQTTSSSGGVCVRNRGGQTIELSPYCQSGQIWSGATNSCVAACPAGQVPASSRPELNTSSTQCVSATAPTCASAGINPATDFVPKCSQMIDGQPSLCLTSDLSNFSIAGCPTIDCGNGVEVIYPETCPPSEVTSCPEGFVLSSLGEGYGNTCVKPAPDKDDGAPCVFIGTQSVCASDSKNCVFSGGQFTCLKPETTQPPGSTCYTANGQLYCLSKQPEITTTKQTDTLPNGTTVTTETSESSVKGSAPQTRTTTTTAGGATTIKSTYNSDVTNLISTYGDKGQNIDLSQVNLNTANTAANTKDIKDALAGLSTARAAYAPNQPPAGGLYTASGKTYGGILTKFKDGVFSTALGQTIQAAFTVTVPASTCPEWTIPATALTPEIVIDQQCAPVMDDKVWPVVRAVIYVVSVLIAIGWAFL